VLNLSDTAARTETALQHAGIETRRWWGHGAHAHRATAALPRAALPATETLAQSTLAVPFYRDLAPAQIARIADVVLAATRD
jgi:dTDP-4-amino-4,6-dideoxygalactose transaminase